VNTLQQQQQYGRETETRSIQQDRNACEQVFQSNVDLTRAAKEEQGIQNDKEWQ
jgi:hypothetical protein